MFRRSAYLRWLVAYIWVPELVLAVMARRFIRRRWSLFAALSGAGVLVGVPWDMAGFRLGFWGLHDGNWLGRRLFGLPVEEWLFCLTAPWLWGAAALLALEVERAAEAWLSGARHDRRPALPDGGGRG